MAKKKLTTEEILKAARAQAGGKPESDSSEDAETGAPKQDAPQSGGTPKSTKDILAAARAQSAGGAAKPSGAKPSADKPSGGTPKSTKDILAAARAQSGGGAAAAGKSADQPAAKSSEVVAAAKPAGDRPSVQDMLKAVREGKPAEKVADSGEADKPKLPPRPQKPGAAKRPIAKKSTAVQAGRRSALMMILLAPLALFSSTFAFAFTMFSAATAAFSLAVARFMMPNVLMEPPSNFKVGPASDYPLGTASTKWKAEFAVWIIHTTYNGRNVIYALSTVCTHLGCTPNWLEGEQKFKCPCHGSGFYLNGVNFEGPAPRPLERYAIRVAEDGMLEVDKSVKFQEEMGEWEDTNSYVEVS